jgi:2-keto-4-pentenoate hydratase/2-oxohepta-3-ene-1,7-dioic acid hydratase in catechol pathway
MIFSTAEVIAYISEAITLEPGDLILTGTPPGVGFARVPPFYLREGDTVTVEIEGVGRLTNPVVRAAQSGSTPAKARALAPRPAGP